MTTNLIGVQRHAGSASGKWLKKSRGTVWPDEAMKLGLSPGSPVYRFHRLCYVDDLPVAIEHTTLSTEYMPSFDSVELSIYGALERAGSRPARALQRLRAVLLEEEQAKLLGGRVGEAGLLVERLSFLRDGRIVAFSRSLYRGDSYDFVAELTTA
ncbi:MAG: GntR family transcriptional regulator [Betaproteobacteria bacterium]